MYMNLPEQLRWHRIGHAKVKSEQQRKYASSRPFPESFVGEAGQQEVTTHDWPTRPSGRDAAGAEARETDVHLPIGLLRAGKGRVKRNKTSVFGLSGVLQRLRTIGHFLQEAELWNFRLGRSE